VLVAEAPTPLLAPPQHAKREWQFFFVGVMLARACPLSPHHMP
jgi:hypothetical protein